ncbi:hypothetical protein WOSG25_330010, partial [Weissella oryzae SG25]
KRSLYKQLMPKTCQLIVKKYQLFI